MKRDSKQKKYAVIGNPIEHSLSPIIHNANFKVLQLNNFTYEKILVEDIRDIRNIALQNELCGFNVTLPWKEKIIPMLDKIYLPNGIYAVNTVAVNLKKKFFVGYNTDIYGILQDFKEKKISLKGKRILLLGYGGLGQTLATILRSKGKSQILVMPTKTISNKIDVKQVVVANRSYKEGVDLVVSNEKMLEKIHEFDIVINTISIHSFDDVDFSSYISKEFNGIFYDCSPMQTCVVDYVNENTKGKAFDGRGMLAHQAAKSFEIWTKKKANVKVMKEILKI